jgi:hypothetical protein
MVAIKPSLATKFLVLQFKGVEFDTKPCNAAWKLPDAPGYRLRHARPSGSVLRPKPRNPPPMVLWPNHQTPRTQPGLTTPSVEPAKPFTSGAQTVYSVLPCSLTWPPPMHRLHVHDFVFLFLHHAARTWSRRPPGPSNQAYLSLHSSEAPQG